jgi:hypothetical protein
MAFPSMRPAALAFVTLRSGFIAASFGEALLCFTKVKHRRTELKSWKSRGFRILLDLA